MVNKLLMLGSAALTVLTLFPVRAADPTGAILWTAQDIKNVEKSLAQKVNSETKAADDHLMTEKTHNVLFFHRVGPGVPEIHEKLADFMVIQNGEGAVMVGGKLIDGKPSAPDEIRGKSLEGATKYKLRAGDVLYIPANTPHLTLVEPGKELDVMVIKVQP
jgi:mannose-6-phosphate isomerase-like protein (cupin superfamily)